MPTALPFDPSTINSSVVAPYTLGDVYQTNGKLYQYVQLVNDTGTSGTPGNGWVVEATSTSAYIVTADRASGSAIARSPVGVLVGTVTLGNYCFMQIHGIHTAVKNTGDTINAVGLKVIAHASTDGSADIATAYTEPVIGISLAASVSAVVPVWLKMGGA